MTPRESRQPAGGQSKNDSAEVMRNALTAARLTRGAWSCTTLQDENSTTKPSRFAAIATASFPVCSAIIPCLCMMIQGGWNASDISCSV